MSLRQLPPDPYTVVAVVLRELVHEAVETARVLRLSYVHPAAVVEALVERGWLPPEAIPQTVRLERQLSRAMNTMDGPPVTLAQARGLEAMADEVIGWLRQGSNRACGE